MSLNANSQLLLGKLETNRNVDPSPTPEADAIKCGPFELSYDPELLERLLVDSGIDAAKKIIGKEYMGVTVPVELDGSGQVGVEPNWGPMLEACGYTKTVLAAATIKDPIAAYGNQVDSGKAFSTGGTFAGTEVRRYFVEVASAGASGVAECSVTCLEDDSQNSTGNVITDATAINLGDEGATFTVDFTSGDMILGNGYWVYCYPPGISYKPTAANGDWESMYFYAYKSGLRFKFGGSMGNWTISCPAGKIAQLNFEFRGLLIDAVSDVPVPDHSFSDEIPPIVENAGIKLGKWGNGVISSTGFQSKNELREKESCNAPNGVLNFDISGRDPLWSADLEAELEATHPFWGDARSKKEFPINTRVGSTPGNIVHIFCRRAAIDNPGMQNKNKILAYGLTGQALKSPAKNDNIEIFVC